VFAVESLQLVPQLGLGATNEGKGLLGEKGTLTIETLAIDAAIAVVEQNGLDGAFEGGF